MTTTNPRHKQIEETILAHLTKEEPKPFYLVDGVVAGLFIDGGTWNDTNHGLQRLRRAGLVKYVRGVKQKGWVLA